MIHHGHTEQQLHSRSCTIISYSHLRCSTLLYRQPSDTAIPAIPRLKTLAPSLSYLLQPPCSNFLSNVEVAISGIAVCRFWHRKLFPVPPEGTQALPFAMMVARPAL